MFLALVDIGPTSYLVFSAHKLPAYHCTTQAFSCMHPYLLYNTGIPLHASIPAVLCSLCIHHLSMHSLLSTHISTMHAFLLRHGTPILCIDLPCTHNVNDHQLYTYMSTIHSSTIYTHFLYVYTRSGPVHIHSTFELSEDTCESTVCVYVL